MSRLLKEAGEQIKLLEENVVSGRIEGHVLLHRYAPIIRAISTVDIIAGESADGDSPAQSHLPAVRAGVCGF